MQYSNWSKRLSARLPLIAVIVTIVFWSSAFVGIRYGIHYYHAESLALLRLMFAAISILPMYWLEKRKVQVPALEKPTGMTACVLVITGILGLGLYHVFLNVGEQHVSAGVASFIVSQAPIVTAVFAFFCLKERLSKVALFGIVVSFTGVLLIYTVSVHGPGTTAGMIAVVLASLFSAAYIILTKYLCRYYRPIYMTMTSIIYSTLLLAIFYSHLLIQDISTAPVGATAVVAYLGVFPTAIAYGAWNYALSAMNASKMAALLYAMPLLVVFFSFVFLHEAVKPLAFLGGCLALLGAAMLAKSKRQGS